METSFYGGAGGQFSSIIFDQGRITGITSWGYEPTYNAIIIDSWTSESKTNSDKIGTGTIVVACTPFSLSSNEYIDGVQVIYNAFVRKISFHISNNNTQICSIDQTALNALNGLSDPGLIMIPDTYLTGFKFRYGSIIDAAGFQFTIFSPSSITITDLYGGNGGDPLLVLFDQGRINAINYWGFSNNNSWNIHALGIIDWSSDQQSSTTAIGWHGWMDVNCTAFTLPSDQYIDGYRIMFNSFVSYIGFQISDGTTKVCAVSPLPSGLTDTGWNTVYHSQLTGFLVKKGVIIDQIALQFTDVPLICPNGSYQVGGVIVNNDISGCGLLGCEARYDTNNIEQCKNKCTSNAGCVAFSYAPKGGDTDHLDNYNRVCTIYDSKQTTRDWGYQIFCILITSNPTQSPTKNPTTNPTTYPTKNPTTNPTKNPSKYPSKNPTKNPTISPTRSPTKYPTRVPTFNPTTIPTNPTKNPTTSPSFNPTNKPTTSIPTILPTKTPTNIPTTYSPTPHSGEIIEAETTDNPLIDTDPQIKAAGAESSFFENEQLIFFVFLAAIILLCCCIVSLICLSLIIIKSKSNKKKNDDIIVDNLERISTSMNQIELNQTTTTANFGEPKSIESTSILDGKLPAPPPLPNAINLKDNFVDGMNDSTDITGYDQDDSTDSSDSADLLYNNGAMNDDDVTSGGDIHNTVTTGGQ